MVFDNQRAQAGVERGRGRVIGLLSGMTQSTRRQQGVEFTRASRDSVASFLGAQMAARSPRGIRWHSVGSYRADCGGKPSGNQPNTLQITLRCYWRPTSPLPVAAWSTSKRTDDARSEDSSDTQKPRKRTGRRRCFRPASPRARPHCSPRSPRTEPPPRDAVRPRRAAVPPGRVRPIELGQQGKRRSGRRAGGQGVPQESAATRRAPRRIRRRPKQGQTRPRSRVSIV